MSDTPTREQIEGWAVLVRGPDIFVPRFAGASTINSYKGKLGDCARAYLALVARNEQLEETVAAKQDALESVSAFLRERLNYQHMRSLDDGLGREVVATTGDYITVLAVVEVAAEYTDRLAPHLIRESGSVMQ